MTCEQAFNRYLSLDKYERVPLSVTVHILFCPVCRTGVRQLNRAEILVAQPLSVQKSQEAVDPVLAQALERIMSAGLAYSLPDRTDTHVSMLRWVISGLALAFGFTLLPFTFMGSWSRDVFGSSFSVPFYILCGVAVTAYCGMFIGTNIDFFVKKFGMEDSRAA